MKKSTLLLVLLSFISVYTVQAQVKFVHTNLFHRVEPPNQLLKDGKLSPKAITLSTQSSAEFPDIATFRIIGPVAGYGITKNNLVTGVGYGYNILHYVDSIQTYHAKISFNAMLWGSAPLGAPSLNPSDKNVIGVGPAVGLFNNILVVGYCWKAPLIAGTSGQSDLVIAGHFPIN